MSSIKTLFPINASFLQGESTFSLAGHDHDTEYLHKLGTPPADGRLLVINQDGYTTTWSRQGLQLIEEKVITTTNPFGYSNTGDVYEFILVGGGGGGGNANAEQIDISIESRVGVAANGGNGGNALHFWVIGKPYSDFTIIVGSGGIGSTQKGINGGVGGNTRVFYQENQGDPITTHMAVGGLGGNSAYLENIVQPANYYKIAITQQDNTPYSIFERLGQKGSQGSITRFLAPITPIRTLWNGYMINGKGGNNAIATQTMATTITNSYYYSGQDATSLYFDANGIPRYILYGCGGSGGILGTATVGRNIAGGDGAGGYVIVRSYAGE